ncbi:MAG: alpha/beta hydrolase family protein, partial [Tabrizicola sp.]
MRAWIVKGLAGLVVIVAAVLGSAFLLDTTERPPEFEAPGYLFVEMPVAGREKPVPLHIWYPTDSREPPTLIGQNGLFYGSHIRKDAPPVAAKTPVVVMSHGSGGNAERLGWLAGYLAHQGMIVVAPNHPGTTSGDSDPFKTPLVWERTGDLTAALDLLQSTPPGGLQPDLDRVAVLGFSLGGYTALGLGGIRVTKAAFIEHCAVAPSAPDCNWMVEAGVDFTAIDATLYDKDHGDPRVKAVVAIDPALVKAIDPTSIAALPEPFLLVNLGEATTLDPAMQPTALADTLPEATYLAVPGAKHFSFLAECSTLGVIIIGIAGEDNICSDAGLRDRAIIH